MRGALSNLIDRYEDDENDEHDDTANLFDDFALR